MRMKNIALIGVIGGFGAWIYHRNKKYPLAKGYGILNKIVIPDGILNVQSVKLANSILSKEKPLKISNDIISDKIEIKTSDDSKIALSIYNPNDIEGNKPCLIYFHGGGFFLKDEAYIHKIVCEYARNVKCCVVFVHYRTADKYPYPVPFQDCCDAIQYVWRNSENFRIDKNKIALGGDSAGGALTGSCALWCRDETNIRICFQMLIYPVTDLRMETETAKKYVDSPLWNSSLSKKMWRIYLRNGINDKKEYASPVLAENFSDLPPAYIEVSEFDSLRDEGIEYATALEKAGVNVQYDEIKGACHGFDVFLNTELTKKAIQKRSKILINAFNS